MSTPVLLLDAAWRVDRVIGVEHACEMLLGGRVVPASEDIAKVMHSPSIEVPIPSVVARTGRLHASEARPPVCSARRVRQRDGHVCQFVIDGEPCERRGDSVDHLKPASHGGPGTWSNLSLPAVRTIRRRPIAPSARCNVVTVGRCVARRMCPRARSCWSRRSACRSLRGSRTSSPDWGTSVGPLDEPVGRFATVFR